MRSLGCGVALLVCMALVASVVQAEPIHFNRDIRPILSSKCFHCHGPDSQHREADLRLDSEEGVVAAFANGNQEKSEAWKRILSNDDDERMPPVDSNLELDSSEKELIRRWMSQGASWQGHWSFIAPESPAIPKVQNHDWIRNPIDAFVAKRHEAEGVIPNPQATRERLLRRVTFDLTGLPPTIKEIDSFVNDESPGAYEKVIDRLLASESFGERMAVAWMDAARYGDSSVFHADGPRNMWPWRDWVINAYNENKPFDRFTIEQLAGDLLPNSTLSQKIATGFNRNNASTDEGGVIPEEFRIEYAVDRVKTTSMVWMGLTMECGQCHEHKYDPISQEEYYKFFAYFNQASDPGMQTRKGNQAPVVDVPDLKELARQATVRKEIQRVETDRQARSDAVSEEFEEWLVETLAKPNDVDPLPSDLLVHLPLDEGNGIQIADAVDAKRKGSVKGPAVWEEGKLAGAFHFNAKNFVDCGDVANFERTEQFSYGCWVNPKGDGAPIARMNDKNGYRGYDLYLQNGGQLAMHLIHRWPDNAIKVATKNKVPRNEWSHVFVTYDGSSKAAGVKLYINGKTQEWNIEANALSQTTLSKVPLYLGRRNPGSPFNGLVDDVRFYSRALSEREIQALSGHDPIGPIFAKPREQWSEHEIETLRKHYLTNHDELYKKINSELARLNGQLSATAKKVSTVMVMKDVPKMRMTYVLKRGDYASPDKEHAVQPGVPASLPPLPEGAESNRLGLAKWLTMPEHPLTARVTVNRYWAMLFGTGIVKSVEDFGSQGEWPSHPALLDWLAVDFVRNGWDIKRTLKQILMSSTYQQSSRVTRQLYDLDPENRLFARGPRFRLQAEFIRDNALAASGLLVNKIGGPSVKPYQPPGLWNEVSLSGNVRFVQDKGEKLYRRSLYIYWKRSAPPPTMTIFDAPSREKCMIRRSRTNTPLQALVTLNDPQFVEASRVLAERIIKQTDMSLDQQIELAYRLVTGHRPKPIVTAVLAEAFQDEYDIFKDDENRAKSLLSIGESPRDAQIDPVQHAAMTIVTSMIFNLDETLTRG